MLLVYVITFELFQERTNEEGGGEEAQAVLAGGWADL
jgi:hypothetical protein